MIKRYPGWKYTYSASSVNWWQELRGKRWILIRGKISSGLKYQMKDLEMLNNDL